jgi:hypothetical protein
MDNNQPGAYPSQQQLYDPLQQQQQSEQEKIEQYGPPPTYDQSQQSGKNIDEILNEIWKQAQVYLCLLVAMLKEKKKTDKSEIISKTIEKIENAPIPEDPGKIICDSDTIAPILSKIKKTMILFDKEKLINKELSDEQMDRIIGANISLIKKYIQLYTDIIKKIDNEDIDEAKKEEGLKLFLAIPEILDNLLNNVSSLNAETNQDQGQGQSIGKVEGAEIIIETFALALASSQMVAGKKFQRKTKKSKRSKKSKKKKCNKKYCSRKYKRQRKLTK